MYYASIFNMTIMDWTNDFQQIGHDSKVKTYHDVDLLRHIITLEAEDGMEWL